MADPQDIELLDMREYAGFSDLEVGEQAPKPTETTMNRLMDILRERPLTLASGAVVTASLFTGLGYFIAKSTQLPEGRVVDASIVTHDAPVSGTGTVSGASIPHTSATPYFTNSHKQPLDASADPSSALIPGTEDGSAPELHVWAGNLDPSAATDKLPADPAYAGTSVAPSYGASDDGYAKTQHVPVKVRRGSVAFEGGMATFDDKSKVFTFTFKPAGKGEGSAASVPESWVVNAMEDFKLAKLSAWIKSYMAGQQE
jgi:hypothetical protein